MMPAFHSITYILFDKHIHQISDFVIGSDQLHLSLFLHFRIACCFAMDAIVGFI